MCHVNRLYPPSPILPVWNVERVIYTVCKGTVPQYTESLSLFLVLTTSSSSSTSSPFCFLPWERVELSFGHHYANFPTRSLGFLELFSNSPLSLEHLWLPLTRFCRGWGPASFLTFFFLFFVLQRAFFYFLCTVSGCDSGNWTHNIAVYTWRFSPLSYDRQPNYNRHSDQYKNRLIWVESSLMVSLELT
jgi:hypothetical protein